MFPRPCEFEKKIADFISAQGLIPKNRPVLIAVSGGADSVALLHVLCRLTQTGLLDNPLVAGHVNHNLRGQASQDDRQFVKGLTANLGLEFLDRCVDTIGLSRQHRLSIETAARRLRLDTLADMAAQSGTDTIATAHQMDDNVETILHRLIRGTGFRGLCAIRPERLSTKSPVRFIRPLLCVSRHEVIDYCRQNNLAWRHDHTNDLLDYTRNRIRHQLLPYLERQNPGITQHLADLAGGSASLYKHLETQVRQVWPIIADLKTPCRLELDSHRFYSLHPLLQAEFIRLALEAIGCGQAGITKYHYLRILTPHTENSDARLDLPGGFTATFEKDKIVFATPPASPALPQPYLPQSQAQPQYSPDTPVELQLDGVVDFAGVKIQARIFDAGTCDIEAFKRQKDRFVEWFDYETIGTPLVARRYNSGERFRPLGAPGPKKVARYLIDAKVQASDRKSVFVISGREKIIWVVPYRIAEPVRVTGKTAKILSLRVDKVLDNPPVRS